MDFLESLTRGFKGKGQRNPQVLSPKVRYSSAQAGEVLWIEDAPSPRVCFLFVGEFAAALDGAVGMAGDAAPPGIEICAVAVSVGRAERGNRR